MSARRRQSSSCPAGSQPESEVSSQGACLTGFLLRAFYPGGGGAVAWLEVAKYQSGELRTASRDICQVSSDAPCELTASQRLRKTKTRDIEWHRD